MFNETYNEVKKDRERIWRIQRGQFILTCERRLLLLAHVWDSVFSCMAHSKRFGVLNRLLCGSYDGIPVRATLGQRLVAQMWVGDTIEVVDSIIHRDKVGQITIIGGRTVTEETDDTLHRQASLKSVDHDFQSTRLGSECILALQRTGIACDETTPASSTDDLKFRFEGEVPRGSKNMEQIVEGKLTAVLAKFGLGPEKLDVSLERESEWPNPRVVSRDRLENEALHIALLRHPSDQGFFCGNPEMREKEHSAVNEALDMIKKGEWTIRPGPHSRMLYEEASPVGAATASEVRTQQLEARESERRRAKLLGQPH
jgi:hypothetical protein